VEELRRAKASAALPADSGVRSAFEGGLLADLPARIAEMEGEIRGLRDINRSKTFKYSCFKRFPCLEDNFFNLMYETFMPGS
jgi:hypothetical protein